ncbi:H/ACA ribonucleoprotein complex non-core subunit NAF1 [Silurus meridionalis]|uniref:H/ACA ribonucleoprotein complex non-core subunit NAF1 n=1 Tax=Silurus meridionalis TaxID=175797 RepID=A0A8T0ALU5_SILME|nr:H/ACA ribonucleoprotein complex non-core subunit NAF1 [Silurus meridionalis]KAF7693892.1 hypothetical protein HF521_007645 [Silurus meridionalis]KAI5093978.1 H/ACA ribonucleoprotein complex non-core subunit NAF1 [Silurus meridionalis]
MEVMEEPEGVIPTSCQCDVNDAAGDDKLSLEHEKGHEVVPDPGVPGLITQMETGVSVLGNVKKDTVGQEIVSEITPNLNEAMETCVSGQDGDQHPETSRSVESDSTVLDVVLESGRAETTSKRKEEIETSVFEGNRDQKTVENVMGSPLLGGGGSLALLGMQYRDESSDELSESESDSSSSTSSSSSSSSSEPVIEHDDGRDEDKDGGAPGKKAALVRTQDELLLEDLPVVENLSISIPENTDMEPVGIISSIVDQLVIIESKKDTPPLNEDSILFNKDRVSIGRVFEVFGPVCQPYYILRFNCQEDIDKRDLKIQEPVYFVPTIKDFTEYIFVEQIKQTKGSDASWKNDQEPPLEALDFSDDEQERIAKQKLKAQRRPQQQKLEESDSDSESSASRPPPPPRRKPRQNRNSQRGRPAHQEHHGGFHANYHANPNFQPDFMRHPPDPYRPPFQGHGYPPFPRAPPPHLGINPWQSCPYPGPIFFPPPPPPPPPSN